MAFHRLTPYTVGETALLDPGGSRAQWVDVTAPDGSQMRLKRDGVRAVRLTVNQPGVWTFRWGQEPERTLEVQATPTETQPAPSGRPVRWGFNPP